VTAPTDDLWVGIDVGTQSVRVLVVSGDGELAARGAAPLSGRRADDRHEQDPRTWWDALGAAARQALDGVEPSRVRGLALDATSGTVLLVDRDGIPLTPGLMYDDTRARDQADTATAAGSALWRRLGYQRMQPSWALPKLLWLLANTSVPSGARLAHQGDYLVGRLAGEPVPTDVSTALKTGCDLITEEWPGPVLAALGVPGEMLPRVVRSGTRIGAVGAPAADYTGVPVGTPILAGMTDGCAAQLGAGVVDPGDWNCVLGTTLVVKGVSETLVTDPSGAVYSHRSPHGAWLPGGASSCGAGAIVRDLPDRDLDGLAAQADRYEPSPVLSYPLASARGERFPFVAPDAEPFRIGEPRDDVETYASLLQGVAFVERLGFDHLSRLCADVGGRRVLSGGAARVPYWSQLRADVMGRPVHLTESAEPAVGMAVLAAASEYGLRAAATAMVRVSAVVDPRPHVGRRFVEPYLRFVDELHARQWISQPLVDQAQREAGS
jgi:sugar (pentulose or hexulose) kinase